MQDSALPLKLRNDEGCDLRGMHERPRPPPLALSANGSPKNDGETGGVRLPSAKHAQNVALHGGLVRSALDTHSTSGVHQPLYAHARGVGASRASLPSTVVAKENREGVQRLLAERQVQAVSKIQLWWRSVSARRTVGDCKADVHGNLDESSLLVHEQVLVSARRKFRAVEGIDLDALRKEAQDRYASYTTRVEACRRSALLAQVQQEQTREFLRAIDERDWEHWHKETPNQSICSSEVLRQAESRWELLKASRR